MSWALGKRDGRWIGYGVPAECDHPDCHESIDRGMAYCCGDYPSHENYDRGCGLYFCENHLWISLNDDDPQMCERCCDEEAPFDPKPDVAEWVQHLLTDKSWEAWRADHPELVATMVLAP